MLTQSEYKSIEKGALKPETSFLSEIESVRRGAISGLDKNRRGTLGQFFTPLAIAQMMSAMATVNVRRGRVRLLDAGAGAGVLIAAFVASVYEQKKKPQEINVTAVELDTDLIPHLQAALEKCRTECERNAIKFTSQIYNEDFVKFAAGGLSGELLADANDLEFDLAILNPPYGKINAGSDASRCLRRRGIVTPNIYASFLALCSEMLVPGGELVAITPRSFCNGTYFKPFRRYFTERMSFLRFHVFDSRKEIFDDDILQENIIFHAVKDKPETKKSEVLITTSRNGAENDVGFIKLKSEELIRPGDGDLFIHIGRDEAEENGDGRAGRFKCTLENLGLQVSTGRVVDFRAKEFLQNGASNGSATAPLIYPHNLRQGSVQYPVAHKKKFDSIRVAPETQSLLVEAGTYVLVKRFSAKEEKKRITASLFEPRNAPGEKIGFENHLNYFHANGRGINSKLAKGLALFLNSSLLDARFPRFSGHTQVNATDLRYLKYPTRAELEILGEHFAFLSRATLNRMNETEINPAAKRRIDETMSILTQLGFPAAQQNEHSALTLLALVKMRPDDDWSSASAPLVGITQMMKYFAEAYDKHYMPNTRESVRRQTVHQFWMPD